MRRASPSEGNEHEPKPKEDRREQRQADHDALLQGDEPHERGRGDRHAGRGRAQCRTRQCLVKIERGRVLGWSDLGALRNRHGAANQCAQHRLIRGTPRPAGRGGGLDGGDKLRPLGFDRFGPKFPGLPEQPSLRRERRPEEEEEQQHGVADEPGEGIHAGPAGLRPAARCGSRGRTSKLSTFGPWRVSLAGSIHEVVLHHHRD